MTQQDDKQIETKISTSYYAIFVIIGVVLTITLNYFIVQNIIIPDPCKYHNADTSKLFQLFYEQTSANGDHPEPTIFNFIFTSIIGGLLGIFAAKKIHKKNHSRQH